jgi:hypothetical protein
MAKKPELHPYSDRTSFDRLMLLIAVLVQHPGIGSRRGLEDQNQDALEPLQIHIQNLAQRLGILLPAYSSHTLKKDLVTLRDYEILTRNRHDWGYYLGTGALNQEELQLALNALASQAKYQGDPQARRVYKQVSQRLRSSDLAENGEFFYPMKTQLNRAIVYSDPEEMMVKQENRNTLFHCLETLETAIVKGLAVELYRVRDPYRGKKGYVEAYPLQMIYQNHAWYFLYEEVGTEHLAIARIDRFKNHVRVLDALERGIEAQWEALKVAHKLLENGWGLFLGELEDQQLERQGKLPLVNVKVRFFPPAIGVILEGEQRHLHQKIKPSPVHPETGELAYVDYLVKLPRRSLNEFSRWVYQFMGSAQVLSPPELIDKHRQLAQALVERYALATKSTQAS